MRHVRPKQLLPAVVIAGFSLASCQLDPYACGSRESSEYRFDHGLAGLSLVAGDSAHLVAGAHVATEGRCYPEAGAAFTSATAPSRFTWSSSNPSVATVSQDGRLVTRSSGQALISVSGNDAPRHSTMVSVVRRGAAILVRPETLTVRVGDYGVFDAYLADSLGAPLPENAWYPYPVMLGTGTPGDSISNVIPPKRTQIKLRFAKSGTYELTAYTSVRGMEKLARVSRVTVVP